MEYRLQQITLEKEQLAKEMATLQDVLQQTKLTSQHHLEDKRHLKATVGELQKAVNETASQLAQTQKELEELKKKHKEEVCSLYLLFNICIPYYMCIISV